MKLFSLVLISTFASAKLAAATAGIVVNEYYEGNGPVSGSTRMASNEYIEFTITQSMTSAQLAALTFGDSDKQTSSLQGVFQFNKLTLDSALSGTGLSAFLPGTIITVKGTGLGAQVLNYNPLATNTTNNAAWSLELVAGQGASYSTNTKINGMINTANAGEVVWISSSNPPVNNTDTSGFISAIGHTTSPGYIAQQVIAQFGASHILNTTLSSGEAISNVGGSTVVLAVTAGTTMSAPNGGANTTWIDGLRTADFAAVPEPSRMLLLLCGLIFCILKRNRRAP